MNISGIPVSTIEKLLDAGRRNRKRANDCLMDDAEINNEPHTKISKFSTNSTSFYIKLAEEENCPERACDTDDSTYDSFHGRETDLCRDTSDTESNYSSDEDFLEYEIASTNESDADTETLSSSGTDDFIIAAAVAHAIYNDCPSDFSLFADTEDSDSTSDDPELGKADYWECVKCKNRQNNPLYRYCEKCYQIRKNLFPPRPKKNRKTRLSQTSGIHKGHHREDNPLFGGGKSKNDCSYIRENNSVGLTVSKEANSAGESGKSDDSDNEYQNHKIINFLNKSPKMCKRRKRLSNRLLTSNTTSDNNNSSSELGETSKNYIVLLNKSSTMDRTDIAPNVINVCSSTKSTDATSNNNPEYSNKLSSQINSNRKRTCDLGDSIREEKIIDDKRLRLDSENETKPFHNKMFKNVIENWSGNSDTDTGDIVKLTPPNELDLIMSCNKDSGFSSSSSQELSPTIPTQDFINEQQVDNSSQETYCPEVEHDDSPVTQVYATSSIESSASVLSDSSAKMGLLSRSTSSQDSFERTQNSDGFEMCIICLTEPKNGVFVHNRFLHSCCCYKCAMKVWTKHKRCPICNCKYTSPLSKCLLCFVSAFSFRLPYLKGSHAWTTTISK